MANIISLADHSIDELTAMLDLAKHLMNETRGPGSGALFDQAFAIQRELQRRNDEPTTKDEFMAKYSKEIMALQASFSTQLRNFVYDRIDAEAPNAVELSLAVLEAIAFNSFSD